MVLPTCIFRFGVCVFKYICLSCFFPDSWRNIQEGTDVVCYHNVHPVGASDMYDFHLLVNATAKMAKSHSLYTL